MPLTDHAFTPDVYTDRMLLSELPADLADEIKRRKLFTTGNSEKVSFVGILALAGKVCVFLPRSVDTAEHQQLLHVASVTLKAVEKFGRESSTVVNAADEGDGRRNLTRLSLVYDLLEDFIQNGIYTRRRDVRKINAGKTDWRRTVNRVQPFPGVGGRPVYLETHGIQRQYFDNCEISIIHADIINQIAPGYSWLVTGNIHPIAPELSDYPSPAGNAEYRILRLTGELNQAYSDRDIRLIKMLIRYLQSDSGDDASNFMAGIEKFHFCWEHMLRKVLNKTVDINSKLPAPAYIDNSGQVLNAYEKGMRTDIVLYDNNSNTYTVADAKYYAATSAGNAPGWGDIVKQLFYDKALKSLYSDALIKNVFIFPGKEGNLKEVRIRDKQKSTVQEDVYVEDFNPVFCYYTDPMEVIENYVNANKMAILTDQLLKQEIH